MSSRPSHRPTLGLVLASTLGLVGLLAVALAGQVAVPTGDADGPARVQPEAAGERPLGLLRGRPTSSQHARLVEGGPAHSGVALAGHGPAGLLPRRTGLALAVRPAPNRPPAALARLAWRGGEAGTSRAPPRSTSA